jgi:hypothetical protein
LVAKVQTNGFPCVMYSLLLTNSAITVKKKIAQRFKGTFSQKKVKIIE